MNLKTVFGFSIWIDMISQMQSGCNTKFEKPAHLRSCFYNNNFLIVDGNERITEIPLKTKLCHYLQSFKFRKFNFIGVKRNILEFKVLFDSLCSLHPAHEVLKEITCPMSRQGFFGSPCWCFFWTWTVCKFHSISC